MWTVLCFLGLFLIVFGLLHLPKVQNALTSRAINLAQDKVDTEVQLGRIDIAFPKSVLLSDLYVEDQQSDTLLYCHKLKVDVDMLALLRNEIQVNHVGFEKFVANVQRIQADSSFNFDFIIEAFKDTAHVEQNNSSNSSWSFDIRDVQLDSSRLGFHDQQNKLDARLNIGHLGIGIETFQLDTLRLNFSEIMLENTKGILVFSGDKKPNKNVENEIPDIGFQDIVFREVAFQMQNTLKNQNYTFNVAQASISADDIDLPKRSISLNQVKIADSKAQIKTDGRNSKNVASNTSPLSLDIGWDFRLGVLDLANLSLLLDQNNAAPNSKGVDLQHLRIENLSSKLENFQFNDEGMQMNINGMSLKERSGFQLNQIAALISVNDDSTIISDFSLLTNNSSIDLDLQSQYSDLKAFRKTPGEIAFNLDISKAVIAMKDIRALAPALYDSLSLAVEDTSVLTLKSYLAGHIADFNIHDFILSIGSDTQLAMDGEIAGMPNIDQLKFDADARLKTTKSFVRSLLPDTAIQSIELPKEIELESSFTGRISDFDTKLDLNTSIGKLLADLKIQNITTSQVSTYQAEIELKQFDIGRILKDTSNLGKLTVNFSTDASGLQLGQINGNFDFEVERFKYKNYSYENLKLSGEIQNQKLTFDSDFTDPNLSFAIDGAIDLNNPDNAYKVEIDLKKAYLHKLHLAADELKMQAKINVDLSIGSMRRINGNADIRDFAIYKNNELYRVDSFLIASVNQDKETVLNLHSDIAEAEFKGNLSILDLGKTLKQHFNHYYEFASVSGKITNDQNFEFYIDIKNTDLITEVLFTKLSKFDPGEIKGLYNSAEKKLNFIFNVPLVGYNKAIIDSLVLKVSSDQEILTYSLAAAEIKDSIFYMDHLLVDGEVKHDTLSSTIVLHDILSEEKYRFGGMLSKKDEDYLFKFFDDGLKFNYKKWQLPKDHYLQIGKNDFMAQNFNMTNKGQSLILSTESNNLNISFDHFNLEALSGLVEGRKRIFRGEVNGEVMLRDAMDYTSISADLALSNMRVRDEPIGEIDVVLTNEVKGKFDGVVDVSSGPNQLELDGYYASTSNKPEMNFNLSIQKLSLATVEAFTKQNISQSSGYLTGNTTISGSFLQPQILGELTFKGAVFEIDYLGTTVHINDQMIDFENKQVMINDFVIRDNDDNPFRMDGSVNITNILNPVIDLDVESNDFLALNTTSEDSNQYYGKLILNSQTSLDGPLNELEISMNIDIGDDSHLTYVVPGSQRGSLERKEIMRFIDKDRENDDFLNMVENQEPDDTLQAPLGLDINAIINMNRNSSLEIVIDPVAGDRLHLEGNANLSLGINPAGDVSLAGQYEIFDGVYAFSFYGVVKKEFAINKGSNLTWHGDVLDADVHVTATHAVDAAPIDLMQSQSSENTESSIYNQKLPFIVVLNMQGKLLKPDITFQLGIEDKAKSYAGGAVYGKIQSINQFESEVNKQVFALLLVNRFMEDNPFASAGGTTEGIVRTSVSKLLSDQLNKWTDQISGLDINVGLKSYEDFSTGDRQGRTDLNLGLSKNFLDDRITVNLAGNVTLEGTNQEQKDISDIAGDVSLEYKLTEDGRFRIVTFRKEVYEALLQGEIIETGAGFIIVEDFDKIGELFQKDPRKKDAIDE
jgi:hypothetical protein